MRRMTAFLLLLALACGARAQALQPAAATPEAAQVAAAMALPDALRQELAALNLSRAISDVERMQRLFNFMVSQDGLALRYQEQPTYGIAESYAQRKVNCLSFTMMYIALARASGMRAYAQASEDALAMRVLDDTLYRAKHVKAGIDADGLQYTVDVGWRSVVAERRPRPITDQQLVALLHNNNAVESLLQGHKQAASAQASLALALDPYSATIWSNAGVVHWRSGQRAEAEQAYLKALSLRDDHIGALGNLVLLYRATGATRLANSYGKQLERAQASDPFSQFLIAQELEKTGAYDGAVAHFRRAIRLLPGEPAFHRSLADTYLKLGNPTAAQRARNRAETLQLRKFSQRGISDADADSGSG